MTAIEPPTCFSLASAQAAGGGLAGAGAGREGRRRDVRAGGDVRDPRRHPAAAADGPADRLSTCASPNPAGS